MFMRKLKNPIIESYLTLCTAIWKSVHRCVTVLFLNALLVSGTFAATVPILTPQAIDKMLALVPPGQDSVFIDDMGFKVSYLEELRDHLLSLQNPDQMTVNSASPASIVKWPNGVVPYTFNANVNTTQKQQWIAACEEWQKYAKVSFVPRTNQANYIVVTSSTENTSYMGMVGGAQTVNIVSWNWKYIICHEIAHALGICHEHSRSDRDSYVTIRADNISAGNSHNFDKLTTNSLGTSYDFGSVMHYDSMAFSKNGNPTITPNPGYESAAQKMGQGNGSPCRISRAWQ